MSGSALKMTWWWKRRYRRESKECL